MGVNSMVVPRDTPLRGCASLAAMATAQPAETRLLQQEGQSLQRVTKILARYLLPESTQRGGAQNSFKTAGRPVHPHRESATRVCNATTSEGRADCSEPTSDPVLL
jgi:hypothetical protein